MKLKKIFKSRAFRAFEGPLCVTLSYILVSIIFGKEIMIFEIFPYYLIMMFIAWGVRYIWLRRESKKKAREEIENENQNLES